MLLKLLSFLLLLSLHLQSTVSAKKDDQDFVCLTKTEIAARLAKNDRLKKRLTRVTNPSTASTEFRTRMPIVQGQGDYERYKSFACEKLCFHNTSKDDPFVELDFISMNDGHHPYDKVLQMAQEEDPYLMTTLRDPVDYAVKNYKRRVFWDAPVEGLKELSFLEWMEQIPWRHNQFTRMMGRENGDTRVVKSIMDPKPTDELREDVYMKQQNELGAESEILKTAWERLSKELHWFGLFHRLPESMKLLGYTFCADTDALLEYYKRPSPPEAHVDKLKPSLVGDMSDDEKEKMVEEILQRNQLDIILFERAEALFDERLEEMKEAQKKGILCKFAGTVDVTCGDEKVHEEL